jgi:hypothetical protein
MWSAFVSDGFGSGRRDNGRRLATGKLDLVDQ